MNGAPLFFTTHYALRTTHDAFLPQCAKTQHSVCFTFQEIELNGQHHDQSKESTYHGISCEPINHISHQRAGSHDKYIGDLGRYMVDMMTLRSRRSQDGGIRNRRNVIPTYRTCQNSSYRHDHETGIMIDNSQNDRNQNPKGAPRGTGGKSKNTAGRRIATVALSLTTLPT